MKRALAIIVCMVVLIASGCKPMEEVESSRNTTVTQQEIVIKQVEEPARNLLSVRGEGNVVLKPDLVKISVYIETQAPDTETASAQNTEILEAVMQLLKDYGIADKDISTEEVRISPEYDYTKGNGEIKGYDAVNTLSVKSRRLDDIGVLINQINAAGAMVQNVDFSVEDSSEGYRLALQEAVKDAQARAQSIAEAAGLNLGTLPLKITETGTGSGSYIYDEAAAGARNEPDAVSGMPLSAGEYVITARVEAEYQIVGISAAEPAQ